MCSQADLQKKIKKKIAKKFNKLENTIIASFQAKQVVKGQEREKIKKINK